MQRRKGRRRGKGGIEREGRVRVHESKRVRSGFTENRGYVRREKRRIREGKLGSLDNNHYKKRYKSAVTAISAREGIDFSVRSGRG